MIMTIKVTYTVDTTNVEEAVLMAATLRLLAPAGVNLTIHIPADQDWALATEQITKLTDETVDIICEDRENVGELAQQLAKFVSCRLVVISCAWKRRFGELWDHIDGEKVVWMSTDSND